MYDEKPCAPDSPFDRLKTDEKLVRQIFDEHIKNGRIKYQALKPVQGESGMSVKILALTNADDCAQRGSGNPRGYCGELMVCLDDFEDERAQFNSAQNSQAPT